MSDRTLLESLASERWFGARDKQATDIKFLDRATISEGPPKVEIVLAAVEFGHKERRVYQLLLAIDKGETSDVATNPSFLQPIGSLMAHGQALAGKRGAFRFGGVGLNPLEPPGHKSVKPLKAEQSNSSVVFDGRIIMKFFRRLEAGSNPDLELNRLLTDVGFEGVPTHVGEITYEGVLERRNVTVDLAIAQQYIGRAVDGWVRTVRSVGELLKSSTGNASGRQRREMVEDVSAQLLSELEQLGDTTAGMHVALGRDDIPPELLSEPLKPIDVNAWIRRAKAALARASRHPHFAPGIHEHATTVIDALRSIKDPGVKMRIHGDYHLGQVLFTRRGWTIFDFEGEPLRTLEERRAKHSPLRDVAGLLRSLSYAASTALFESASPDTEEWRRMEPWADTWETLARDRFLAGYRRRSHEGRFLPSDRSALALMLSFFELDKALYEYIYETEHRPEWVRIPLRGIRTVLRRRRRR